MKVLVFLEQREGNLKSSSFEALTVAAGLAKGNASSVAGLVVGDKVAGLADTVRNHGADTVFVADNAGLKNYNVMTYTQALEKAVAEFSPDVVLGIASPMGRDLFARVAARLKAGLITDLVAVHDEGGFVGGVKPFYAGKILGTVRYKGTGLRMATLRPNVFAAKEGPGRAEAKVLAFTPKEDDRIRTLDVRKGRTTKADLTEASRIISGGRALANADNFKILHECAEVINATVGASRAAVDSGYAPHDMQVGQTGKTVNPNLYIAVGISGSIQHMAGMRTSKVIVAINTDPEAPIFSIANYGIVGDLFEAMPILTRKLKEILK